MQFHLTVQHGSSAEWWAQQFGKSLPFFSWVPVINEIPTNRAMLFLIIAFAVLPTISFKMFRQGNEACYWLWQCFTHLLCFWWELWCGIICLHMILTGKLPTFGYSGNWTRIWVPCGNLLDTIKGIRTLRTWYVQ
ncbi:Choline/ethanolaminephosphotransferase 1 [Camellia lanceoleosa]|uniref:Choline/ethanolaminephosphotransferase 1 n=1 Tax=Camellia lanceoleosa TaxID=1840588 RepID=A0ACC0GFL9_9ERIC|nr:Choline/ethanolaminephosphotransferase 1 [Camellia lanceoleosa]